jgi:uncharacterized protein with NAD-binding domain and iron-sulfur cluster
MSVEHQTRRGFLREAGVAGVAMGAALSNPAEALTRRPRRRRHLPTVAVLGGGVAGMSAAHELAQRGFRVWLYEQNALGGKARSIPVPGSARGGRRRLPGEHGFRIEFGFYQNLSDTMRRIPVPGNANGVHDNLVAVGDPVTERSGGREGIQPFAGSTEPLTFEALPRLLAELQLSTGQPPDELAFLMRQLAIFLSSSDERRLGQWEHVSWWDFLGASQMSRDYQRLWATGATEGPAALKARKASTRTVGTFLEAVLLNRPGGGRDGAVYRVLNAPTNEAWIHPWAAHLRALGVRLRIGRTIEALNVRHGRIVSARVRDQRGRRHLVDADYFVCALPVRAARRLWSPAILAADPRLADMHQLETAWQSGIQFFLRQEVPITHGQVGYVDSPWAIASVSQAQFWRGRHFPRDYGDGTVMDCLSATIARWNEPGIVYGKTARECTAAQIAREVWAQIKAHLEDTGLAFLPEGILHSWFLDPAVRWRGQGSRRRVHTAESMFLNTVGSWENRPEAATAVPNLFLAGDYIRANIDFATMEGANESARAAVNALLERSGVKADPVTVYKLRRPPEFEPAKRVDAARFRRGEPHVLDTPWPGPQHGAPAVRR